MEPVTGFMFQVGVGMDFSGKKRVPPEEHRKRFITGRLAHPYPALQSARCELAIVRSRMFPNLHTFFAVIIGEADRQEVELLASVVARIYEVNGLVVRVGSNQPVLARFEDEG